MSYPASGHDRTIKTARTKEGSCILLLSLCASRELLGSELELEGGVQQARALRRHWWIVTWPGASLSKAGFEIGSFASRVVDRTTELPCQNDQNCADPKRYMSQTWRSSSHVTTRSRPTPAQRLPDTNLCKQEIFDWRKWTKGECSLFVREALIELSWHAALAMPVI